MVALESTTRSLSAFSVTVRFSRGATATCENSAPLGFQHLVHPQTWLWALWPLIDTATFRSEHLQYSAPPAKFAAAGLMPLSTAGWMESGVAIVNSSSSKRLAGRSALSRAAATEYCEHNNDYACTDQRTYPTTTCLRFQLRHKFPSIGDHR